MTRKGDTQPGHAIFKQRVTRERNRLVKLYIDLSDVSMKRCQRLFDQLAFLAISIDSLQRSIIVVGTTIEYQNGENQWGTKINPDVDTLNKYLQQFRHTKKAIDDELPRESPSPLIDDFEKWTNG